MKQLIRTAVLLSSLVFSSVIFSSLARAEVKLYIFDCGRINFDDVSAFGITNEETTVRQLFVPCYIIEHENGRMIWDAGLPLNIVGRGEPTSGMWYEKSLLDQMADMDLKPEDVNLASFSHFHYDHVGAANAFKSSTLLIQSTEYAAAFEHPETNPVFNPSLYNDLKDSPRIILNGDHDVFGDGTVKIISAPGHTPGHQALYLELENFGPLILSGDLYHFVKSREDRRTPSFNTDAEETLKSMDKVEALVKSTGATFWIEHNLELAKTLKMAPAFYD